MRSKTVGNPAMRLHLKSCLPLRETEQAELLNVYRRLASAKSALAAASNCGPQEIILLSGRCGSGKTWIAKTLHQPALDAGEYFLSGKFDQLNLVSPMPYAAFSELAEQVLKEGEDAARKARDGIDCALSGEAVVLTRMIPAWSRSTDVVPLRARQGPRRRLHGSCLCSRSFSSVASLDHLLVLLLLLLDDDHFALRQELSIERHRTR
jgi:hypothetical protein